MQYYLNITTDRLDGNRDNAGIKGLYNFYNFINRGWIHEARSSAITSVLVPVLEISVFGNRETGILTCIIHGVLVFALCMLLFALARQIVTMEMIYRRFAVALGEPVVVKGVYAYNDVDNDKMENPEIVPGIGIRYDCGVIPKDQMAVMFKLDEDLYGIISFLDCSRIEKDLYFKIPADVVFDTIRHYEDECVSDQNISLIAIGRVDASKKIHDKISINDINDDIFITELVWLLNFKRKGED